MTISYKNNPEVSIVLKQKHFNIVLFLVFCLLSVIQAVLNPSEAPVHKQYMHLDVYSLIMLIYKLQRVPALRAFWDLEKTVLHETRVSGTVLWSPTNANSPTYTYISQKPW